MILLNIAAPRDTGSTMLGTIMLISLISCYIYIVPINVKGLLAFESTLLLLQQECSCRGFLSHKVISNIGKEYLGEIEYFFQGLVLIFFLGEK